MSTIRRVWFVSHYSMPPQYEMRIKTQMYAHYLQQMGIECTIFSASTIHNTDINLITDSSPYIEKVYDDLHFVHIKCRGYKESTIKRIINMQEFAWRFLSVAKKFSIPDVIIADVNCTNYFPIYLFCKRNNVKFILDVRDLWPLSIVEYLHIKETNPLIRFLYFEEKRMYMRASDIVFSMGGAYDYLQDKGWTTVIPKNKVHYINNGVDVEQFEKNMEQYRIEDEDLNDKDTFKIVYTGSIRKVNNLGIILDVAKSIHNKKIKFLIWGSGDELDTLKTRRNKEKIENVVFKGQTAKRNIPYILSKADLNIAHNNPSPLFKYGISFNKIFDYFAAGKPILCDFFAKYNPVIIEDAGFEITTNNPQEIAKSIEDIADISEVEYFRKCKNAINASRKYDYKALTEQLFNIIHN